MRRSVALSLVAIGLLVGLGGLSIVMNRPASHATAAPINAAAIYADAEARVQKPALPPRPAGATELAPKIFALHIPPGRFTGAPGSVVNHQIPQIAANSQAATAWQSTVDAGQAAYLKQLQAEIDKLTAAQAADAAAPGTPPAWITTVLIPLMAAVAGLLTALTGLIAAIRGGGGGHSAA